MNKYTRNDFLFTFLEKHKNKSASEVVAMLLDEGLIEGKKASAWLVFETFHTFVQDNNGNMTNSYIDAANRYGYDNAESVRQIIRRKKKYYSTTRTR